MTDVEAIQAELTDAQRETFQALINMGFDQTKSLNTAQIFGANTEEAINYLLDDNAQINNYNADTDTNNVPQNDDSDEDEFSAMGESHLRQSLFRINHISQAFVCGFFHESVIDHDTIFPEVIQNLMMQYANLLFIKIKHHQQDSIKNVDQKVEYLTIDEDQHHISFRSIALLIEKQNYSKTNNTTIECPEDSTVETSKNQDSLIEYPKFINLWMRLGLIRNLYSLPRHSAIYTNIGRNRYPIDRQRWCELPADLEFASISDLDQKLKDRNKFIEIVVKQNNEAKMKKLDHSKIRIGDIIDVYKEDDAWYESVVTSMDMAHVGIHYIGLCENANEILLFGSSRIEARGTYSNGPCRRNEWRHSLNAGYRMDIYDNVYDGRWYEGHVVNIKVHYDECTEEEKVKVHYDGYSTQYDEYVERYSERLQQLNTYTEPDPFWNSLVYPANP